MGSIGGIVVLRGAAVILACALGGGALGCGGGYDEEEATATCEALVSTVDTSDRAAFDECVACFEECGDDCAVAESFPPQFICQD